MNDPLFRKARAFTDLEDAALLAWVQALNAGLNREAQDVLDAGLYVEHLTSLLPADVATWTPEQAAEIDRATKVFSVALDAVTIGLTRLETERATGSPEQGSGGGTPTGGSGYGHE